MGCGDAIGDALTGGMVSAIQGNPENLVNYATHMATGGITQAVDAIQNEQGIGAMIIAGIDPGHLGDKALVATGEGLPPGLRDALATIMPIVGSFFGPIGTFAGAAMGARLRGASKNDAFTAGAIGAGASVAGNVAAEASSGLTDQLVSQGVNQAAAAAISRAATQSAVNAAIAGASDQDVGNAAIAGAISGGLTGGIRPYTSAQLIEAGLSAEQAQSVSGILASTAGGAASQGFTGGDATTGAITGAVSGIGTVFDNYGNALTTDRSTGGLQMADNDPFGWGASNLDYSYDSNIAGNEFNEPSAMGWIQDAAGNIKWGPILGAVATAGISALGATSAANAANQGLNNAANATNAATAAQIQSQEKMYQQGRRDFSPFLDMAPRSLATLQSSIYGTPQTYRTATGGINVANAEQFDLKNFTPEGTPAYEWQKKRGLEDLRTQLMMMGRPSGTVAANANSRFLGDLNAKEYESGYNRLFNQKQDYVNNLLNLGKIAQGAAGSTSALGATAANNTSNAFQNQGNTLANISNAQGQTNANLYSGLASLPLNIANTAIRANQSGMF